MWRDYIQPGLLLRLDAVAEDTAYLDPNSEFIDMDGDGKGIILFLLSAHQLVKF